VEKQKVEKAMVKKMSILKPVVLEYVAIVDFFVTQVPPIAVSHQVVSDKRFFSFLSQLL
jgi:hypothetical protein